MIFRSYLQYLSSYKDPKFGCHIGRAAGSDFQTCQFSVSDMFMSFIAYMLIGYMIVLRLYLKYFLCYNHVTLLTCVMVTIHAHMALCLLVG